MSENNAIITFQPEESKSANGESLSVDMSRYASAVFSIRISNMSGTTPTITPKLMHSIDKVNFVELHSFGTLNTESSWILAIPNATEFGFLPYVKWEWTVGGTDPNFTIELKGVGKE